MQAGKSSAASKSYIPKADRMISPRKKNLKRSSIHLNPLQRKWSYSQQSRARQHKVWRGLAWLACGVLVYVAYSYLGGSSGLIQYGRLQLRRLKLEKEISLLQARQDSLKQTIFLLQNDTTYIEKIARERYYMGRPGETIYTVVRQPQANDKSK